MKRKLKKLMSALTAFAIAATLFASAAMAADIAIYKSTSGDSTFITRYVDANGYIVYNQGSSGYIQYNQVDIDTGYMPFGTPTAGAGKTISRSKANIIAGNYFFKLTGTGVGMGYITGL